MSIVSVIPARGGSKGIPRKNLRDIGGLPLIAHTIDASLESDVDVTLVSTEDEEIAEVSRQFGATVIMRPPELALDTSPTEPAYIHAILEWEKQTGLEAKICVLLQCTSPLRSNLPINECIAKITRDGFDSALTASRDTRFHWELISGEGIAQYDYLNRPRRQDIKRELFEENGAAYAATRRILIEGGNRLGGKIGLVEMHELDSTEIDDEYELWLAAKILEYRNGQQ